MAETVETWHLGPLQQGASRSWRRTRPTAPRCDLYKAATQVVFGEGPPSSRLVMVGEQPGDQEDEQGAPFVGPAGQLLDRAMHEAGIDRSSVYLTNAVKHFKWEPRGKRRIHKTPNQTEIVACQPWLASELELIDPELVVALGATAVPRPHRSEDACPPGPGNGGPNARPTACAHHRPPVLGAPHRPARGSLCGARRRPSGRDRTPRLIRGEPRAVRPTGSGAPLPSAAGGRSGGP